MVDRDGMDIQAALRNLDAMQQRNSSLSAKRRFVRYQVRGEARLLPSNGMLETLSPVPVHVRDISRGGAGLLSSVPAQPGHRWQLQLIDSNLVIDTLPAFCRYCRRVSEGAYLIGVEFGLKSSIMLAMGIPAKELARNDEKSGDDQSLLSGEFVGPESLLDADTAA